MSRVPYVSAVGSLMYAMVCTIPDFVQSVNVVSRFMGDPGKEHWQVVKRVLRYLKGTSDVALIYGGDIECLVIGFSNSDYAGDVDRRRSMTDYAFTLGGSIVIWKATLQPTATVYYDSLRAICLAKDQVYHERTKHIDVRYHFLRSEKRIQDGSGVHAKIIAGNHPASPLD
ncbi:secreted RxLR effector protein 161-like [Apium graveolens]|uniref:secreted RxLR effector protein 161-like n=1 Tax=Apium graveolens TaxID=4045 RepID=UPI003D7B7CD3